MSVDVTKKPQEREDLGKARMRKFHRLVLGWGLSHASGYRLFVEVAAKSLSADEWRATIQAMKGR